MTDTNTKAAPVKTVLNDMAARSIFDGIESATAYLTRIQTELSDFGEHPTIIVGFDNETGEFDPTVYTDQMNIAVSVLTNRADKIKQREASVKAIVVYPSPKLEAILAESEGTSWLTGILEKELNHVAVRNLRKAETTSDMTEAMNNMPKSVMDYVTTRESTSTILEVYNDLWQLIKKLLSAKLRAFAVANLSKKELKKSLESAAYAEAFYPKLESRTDKAGNPVSYFVKAAELGVHLAKTQGLDPAFFENCILNRDAEQYDEQEDEDFDVEELAELALADDSEDDEAGTESDTAAE